MFALTAHSPPVNDPQLRRSLALFEPHISMFVIPCENLSSLEFDSKPSRSLQS